MALLMVHLLAAWNWAQDKPKLRDNPDYYLGAISPDAIHIRDGNDKSHKNATHLNNWRTPDTDAVLAYWREHATPFDIGYGIHVLLDGQWAVRFRKRLPGILLPGGKPDPDLYYTDTLLTDFALYRRSALMPRLMELVRRARAPKDHPLLTAEEFDGWRNEMLAFYDKPCPKHGIAQNIDLAYVDAFLDACGELFDLTYERMRIMNETQKSILDRRSTRGFTDEALTQAELSALADAALASPSARNYQDWHFIFVRNRELLAEFSREFCRISGLGRDDSSDPLLYHAPLMVLITLPEQPLSRFPEVDAGIAVQNLALSAQALGLGSVIIGQPLNVFKSEAGKLWETRLGFPAGHRFAIGIAIGHNSVTKAAHEAHPDKISYID